MKKISNLTGALYAGLFTLVLVTPTHASLIDRGGGLIYDDDLDITWLQNANLGAGSIFDDGFNNSDGRMTWDSAVAWADQLVYGGFNDWRLPTTLQPDPTCGTQSAGNGFGQGCTGSEMGHLFNVEGITQAAPDLFFNIGLNSYWSGTELAPNPIFVWSYLFTTEDQGTDPKSTGNLLAWAVRPGDVSASVPEPATTTLFGIGLLSLLRSAWRKR